MSFEGQSELTIEAKIFGKYLLGEDVNARAVALYLTVHDQVQFELDEEDQRVLQFVLEYPVFIGIIDGGLAIRKNKSCVRKKLYYMLAILESMPEYARHFLFAGTPISNLLRLFLSGIRGVMRMIMGYFLCGVL